MTLSCMRPCLGSRIKRCSPSVLRLRFRLLEIGKPQALRVWWRCDPWYEKRQRGKFEVKRTKMKVAGNENVSDVFCTYIYIAYFAIFVCFLKMFLWIAWHTDTSLLQISHCTIAKIYVIEIFLLEGAEIFDRSFLEVYSTSAKKAHMVRVCAVL